VGGITVNRFCASGLSAVQMAADRIRVGEADVMIAAGVESMSMVPMMGNAPSLSPAIFANTPDDIDELRHRLRHGPDGREGGAAVADQSVARRRMRLPCSRTSARWRPLQTGEFKDRDHAR
jgi:acetyl-CoA acetyltransferase